MSSYGRRLVLVAASAAITDQVTKLIIRAAFVVGEKHHLVASITLVRIQRSNAGSATATFVLAAALVLAALIGFSFSRANTPSRTWLFGGLLIGGAISAFGELVIAGYTTDWLSLPLKSFVSAAYVEMVIGAIGLFFHAGRSRRTSA
jgi:lipoprotein signal peptidase